MSVREIDPYDLGVVPEATEATSGGNNPAAEPAREPEFLGLSSGTPGAILPIIMNTQAANETTPAASNHMEIAGTILHQIIASDFWARARWGAKQSIGLGGIGQIPGLMLNCTRGNKIIVKLDASDTYTVEIVKLRGRFAFKTLATEEGIHAEALVVTIDRLFSKCFGNV